MAQTAIVTGGAGFIGSHLVDALIDGGSEVIVIDDLSSGRESRVNPKASLKVLDVVDGQAVQAVVSEAQPAAVYHLAAQASVTVSVKEPSRDLLVNVAGTLNVVDAATKANAPVVFTSTGGALYGDQAPVPTSEEWIPQPLAPYGASKWAAEAYVNTWSLASGVPHAVCRLGNVYGPRQSPHGEAGVVSIFALHLHRGTTPKIYGHGTPTRDYVYVKDVVDALIAASGKRGTFNIATQVETDVSALWARLKELAGSDVQPQMEDLRPGELKRSLLDIGRAEKELSWGPKIAIGEGLALTYQALVEEFRSEEQAGRSQ